MKIRLVSDIHTEFLTHCNPVSQNGRDYCASSILHIMENEKDQVLILSGDIANVSRLNSHYLFFKDISERFKAVVYAAGNHESYGSDIGETYSILKDALKEFTNIHILDRESVTIDDVLFIGATLWTNFEDKDLEPHKAYTNMNYAHSRMNDYNYIKLGKNRWSPAAAKNMFESTIESFTRLFNENKDKKIVVVTHHGCSYKSVDPFLHYEYSPLNPAYFSHLDEYILEHKPVLWTHGHTHTSHDYMIGDTRVVVNPHGYYAYPKNENKDYNPLLVIDI